MIGIARGLETSRAIEGDACPANGAEPVPSGERLRREGTLLRTADLDPIKAASVSSSLDGVVVIDDGGVVLGLNPSAEALFGYSQDEAVGQPIADLIVPDHLRSAHLDGFAAYLAGRAPRVIGKRVEVDGRHKDGRLIPIELSILEIAMAERRVFTATIRDRSEDAARDEELENTRRQLELAIEGANMGAWTFNPTTGAIWYSERSRQIYGLEPHEPLDVRTLRARVHPEDWERLSSPYYHGFPHESLGIEYRVIRPDGEERWVYALGAADRDENGVAEAVHGIHLDVTERKRGEEELARSRDALLQSEKLASLGALLAGVSHELNNPLAAIVGQAEMLAEDARGTALEQRAIRISAAAERCARIVQTFLAMARQRERRVEMVSLNDVIASALDLTDYALRTSGIAVRVNFGSALPPVEGDRDQLHQVLVNLVVNAQQAMEKGEAFEKILTIRTSVNQAGRVLVDVADTGPGVPEGMRHRIFEPFFTTKKHGTGGGGTGIGLSFSQGIVAAHGGTIRVEPSRRGAHFRVELPAAAGAPIRVVPQREPTLPDMVPARRRCLVVEDEPDVAETLRELIEREGYEVTLAANGTEAFFALDHGEFDLLFSDLRMPLLNGPELHERLCEIRPELVKRMAFVTGDTMGDNMGEFLRSSGRPVLEKPFTKAGIRAVLAALVETRS